MESFTENSRSFLAFKTCKTCAYKPCERLRFGRVFPGKYTVLHTRYLTTRENDCPFLVQSFSHFLDLIDNASLLDVIASMQDILAELSVEEQIAFNTRFLITDYNDRQGRILVLEWLWNSSVLAILHVPYDFYSHQKMAKWLLVHEALHSQQMADSSL
jgi:hypothetical protein